MVEIAHGYIHNYYNLIGQSNYACSSHSGCVGRRLANAIIFDALYIGVDDVFVDFGCDCGMLVNALCLKFQQIDAIGIENSVGQFEAACTTAVNIMHYTIYNNPAEFIFW